MRGRNSTIRKAAKLVVLCLIGAVVFFSSYTAFNKTKSLSSKTDLAQHGVGEGYHLVVLNYNGENIDKIYFNTETNLYGWCIDKGANLYGGQGSVSAVNNAFENNNAREGCSGSMQWLLDNMYRAGSGVSNEEKEYFKEYLQQIVNKNSSGDISGYSEDDIYAYEQFVIWNFTNNVTVDANIRYPNDNPLYSALLQEARNNAGYVHKNTSVTVDKTAAVVAENGAVGPFRVTINGQAKLSSNLGTLYKSVDLNENNVLSDREAYTGDIYLKATDTSNVQATISWVYYTTTAEKYETTGNPGDYRDQSFVMINREKNSQSISFEGTYEEEKSGSFNFKLVKYLKDDTKKLAGAIFGIKISVMNDDNTEGAVILDTTGITDNNGEIVLSQIPIQSENQRYKVVVKEVTAPAGYIGISGDIQFFVSTKLEGKIYKLVADNNVTVANAKKVEVGENQILVETENRTTNIDIHKGVKTVENQDSGYFYKDTNSNSKAENKNNLEISSLELNHKWVVETTIPENVTAYNKYMVKDPIDLTKLDFTGIATVERVDSKGKVLETLTKDKDYKLLYTQDLGVKKGYLTITYINKKDGNNFTGDFLTTEGISSRPGIENTKLRLTFYTTFKVNEDGKLAVLDGTISNAENKSNLIYDNGNNEEISKESETPEVHTGAVSVFKYEDTNGNKKHDEGEKALVGAEFKIAATEEDAKNGKFISINGEELTAVTNEHGIATFTGLEFGGDAKGSSSNLNNGLYKYDWEKASREYYLVETKTPEGYEKIEDIIKVTVSKNSSQIIDLTEKIDEMESVGNKPLKFDLALRKWVTEAIVTENGKTVVYKTGHKAEDNPEDVVKVDLKKSKLKDITVKFKYSIRVTNEGQIEGEAQEITDYIPEGLKFVKEDNPDWVTTDDERVVKTDKLKGVTLKTDESAEVEIILTWVNSEKNMGKMTNTAEISKDYNKYNVHDIDSTPNNKKADEDDIDIAEVMLSVKTGSEILSYIVIGVGFFVVIMVGVGIIRKKFSM